MTAPATDAQPPMVAAAGVDGENHLSLSWVLGHPLVGAAALASAGAGLVHAAAAGTHAGAQSGAFAFAVTAALQVAWAFAYLARPSRLVAAVGFVLNGSFAAAWAVSRTTGLPAPESLAGVEHIGIQDGIAAGLGFVAVVCAALALWKSDLVARHRSGSVIVSTVVGVAVVALSTVGAAAGHSHSGTETGETAMGGMDHSSMGSSGMAMGGMGGMAGMSMATTSTTALPLRKGAAMNTSDIAFAQSALVTRHQQLRMAEAAATNSTNPQVVAIAAAVKADPAPFVPPLEQSLRAVDQPVPSASVLTKSSMAAMPVLPKLPLATESEMVKLESSFGRTFDRLYVEIMTRQNRGALGAAEQALSEGQSAEVRDAARTFIAAASAQQRTFTALTATLA